MQVAIVHEDSSVYIAIPEQKVREILREYEHLSPEEAFDELIKAVKRKALVS